MECIYCIIFVIVIVIAHTGRYTRAGDWGGGGGKHSDRVP